MTPRRSAITVAAAAWIVLLATTVVLAADVDEEFVPVPTCASLGETWYFPNACPAACEELGSVFDTDRSRNVNGQRKCFCEGSDRPYCTDDPRCVDLGIRPGTVREDCSRVCGGDNRVKSKTSVEFNGYQFHYVVSCSCSDGTRKCDNNSILLSDLDYMPSCTGGGDESGGLDIGSAESCDGYCGATGVFTRGGSYLLNGTQHRCACPSPTIITDSPNVTEAVVCDDSIANVNDGSGLGDPCYENVGVTKIDCPDPDDDADSKSSSAAVSSEQSSTAKTFVSSATIFTGVWLLPW